MVNSVRSAIRIIHLLLMAPLTLMELLASLIVQTKQPFGIVTPINVSPYVAMHNIMTSLLRPVRTVSKGATLALSVINALLAMSHNILYNPMEDVSIFVNRIILSGMFIPLNAKSNLRHVNHGSIRTKLIIYALIVLINAQLVLTSLHALSAMAHNMLLSIALLLQRKVLVKEKF
jgi:hypothetical protein